MAINPNEINIKNIVELIQSSSIKDNDLLVIGQGIYARKSTVLELYNKFGVPSILTSLNSLQFQINQLNNTVGNSVLYSPQVKTPQQKADARNNLDVYSRSETQTVVNSAIVNLGNVVNSVNGVNVDNTDPKNPIVAEFRPIADYNNDMLNKADIDGNLTTGGIWWQDQVLSDRFANYKQVWTALTNNTIEWGNVELDKHIFLVDDINGLKIKVGGTEGTIWNTLNLTNVSQLNNDAGYLQANDLDGFIYDVQYNSSSHTITFYQQNEPNIVIDLPIEQLIKGVQLVGNDLVFTFEDSSTVTVPLNTLLVGVVKSVNGLTPNSQGEIVLQITDIPNLSSELSNKLDIRMAGLVSNLTQPEKDAILSKLGVVNNIVQVLGLSGNTITLSNGGGSISLNIANIGGLQTALDLKANVNGNNLTNIADWRNNLGVYSTTQVDGFLAGKVNNVENAYGLGFHLGTDYEQPYILHNDGTYSYLATRNWVNGRFSLLGHTHPISDIIGLQTSLDGKANTSGNNLTNITNWQSVLGINTALGLNLQQVTNNGSSTTNSINVNGLLLNNFEIRNDTPLQFLFNNGLPQRILTGGILASGSYADAALIPVNGGYFKGNIATASSLLLSPHQGGGASITYNPNGNLDITPRTGYNVDFKSGALITLSHGTSGEWKYSYDYGLMSKGNGFISNTDANALTIGTEIVAIETGNGSGNTNFPSNNTYGNFTRQQSRTFTTDWFSVNGGDMWFKTWYNPNGAGSNNWRKIWDNVNLVNPATETWVNNNFASTTTLGNYVSKAGDTMSGNLGVGVIPSAWAYRNVIQVGKGGSIAGSNDNNFYDNVEISANVYINSAGDDIYIQSNYAQRYKQERGNHIFYSAVSGIAGQIIPFTKLFEINAIGNAILLGNLSIPNATAPNHAVAFGQLANYALLSQVYTQSQALALFVGLNGVQTIADTKTFTSSPIVPNGTLSGHTVNKSQLDAVSASIPTVGNGQLSFTAPTGLNISGTFNANQSGNTVVPLTWQAGYQGFTTAEATKLAGIQAGATVPNNGTFTVQGTGALTGSGSTSANASANTLATLDLTTATKNDITAGKNASIQVNNLFGSISRYYKLFNMTGGGFVNANQQVITQIFTTSGNQTINISDHTLDGADLKIYGATGGVTTVNINAVDLVGSSLTTVNLEGNGRSFHWSADLNAWVEYFN